MLGEHRSLEKGGTNPLPGSYLAAPAELRALDERDDRQFQDHSRAACAHLGMIDLNLFRVFDELMLHRSVRKASQILSVTPSAVSHALSRLRQSIGDELFIPTESGMQPTQRALELASGVREGLQKLELALNRKGPAPPNALRTFSIGATDYPSVVILPSLIKKLAKSVPDLELRVFSSDHIDVVQQLENGRADLVIGSFAELPAGVRRSTLLREDEVIAVRTGHPLTLGRVTKQRLLEFPQIVVGPTGVIGNESDGFPGEDRKGKQVSVESALKEFQYGRISPGGRAAVCVPTFAAVAPFLQMSDMVAILPRRIALWAATNAPLVLLDPPYPPVIIEIEMLWHQDADQDQGLRWLVSELAESIGDLG
jgi:DNA-binding transcriptional LysR family regulator